MSSSSRWARALAALGAVLGGRGSGSLEASPRLVRNLVVGVDVGTESLRLAIIDSDEGSVLGTATESLATTYPEMGQSEQEPMDWWLALGRAMEEALQEADVSPSLVRGLCVASTSCTVLACEEDGRPLRPAIMWCDARAASEVEDLIRLAENDPALVVNCGGSGPVSAEWMIPKSMWLKAHEPRVWEKADVICEGQDWLNFMLTGEWVAGGCNVATRWHCDGSAAATKSTKDGLFAGRPITLLRALDLDDLGVKWPKRCVAMGAPVGRLSAEARDHLGLSEDCWVVQGGADAFVALVASAPEGGCLVVTGSSHLHLVSGPIQEAPLLTGGKGCWGPYRGAPLPDQMMAEGGQSSTGSILRWAQRRIFSSPSSDYGESESLEELDQDASALPIGAEGLLALETFQGARTPVTDPYARGCLVGLSLAHTRAHVWRALLEAIALGTRASLAALDLIIPIPDRIRFCGGATLSKVFTQMHADAANASVAYDRRHTNLVVTGAAVLAAAFVGSTSIARAAAKLTRGCDVWTVEPISSNAAGFEKLYEKYSQLAPTLSPLVPRTPKKVRSVHVSASVLAADAGALRDDAVSAHQAGAWIHVDVCDGSSVSCGSLSSLGPASIRAVREALPEAVIDVHLAVRNPASHVESIAQAGASRITFQRESVRSNHDAIVLAKKIKELGSEAGVCLAPSTPVSAIENLLSAKLVDLVDILAVNPGRGGQQFQHAVLDKIKQLRSQYPSLLIQVDGGVNETIAPLACQAGADVLAAGSFIFPKSAAQGPTRSSRISDAVAALRESAGPPAIGGRSF